MGLHPFTTYVLRKYYQETGWNEDNLYSNLTRSSDALLDFSVPRGLQFSLSKAPNPMFRTTYSMNVLPSLRGSVGYIFSSCNLDLKSSGDARFKDLVERFKIYDVPKRPEGKPEEWLAGKRVDTRDYLLSGMLYIPTGRLDAFYTTRWSATTQASVACITEPTTGPVRPGLEVDSSSGIMLLTLQHDTGRWGSEFTWNSDGGIWGFRILRNFGKLGHTAVVDDSNRTSGRMKRVDEEEAMEGGLKGRISAGAEFYVSTENSAGVSTGVRFTTLPDHTNQQEHGSSSSKPPPSQPPTTITAIFNPITGHILTTYAAKVSRDLALASRFSFNIHSFESEWTMGGEWWMNRKKLLVQDNTDDQLHSEIPQRPDEIQSVLKARISTSSNLALLWEGRIRNALVSLGVRTDLSNRSKPITAIGLELAYFSSES